MNNLFKNQPVDNSLIAAFNSLKDQSRLNISSKKISELYSKYFNMLETCPNTQNPHFERFSLVDPNIRVVLTSTTKAVR